MERHHFDYSYRHAWEFIILIRGPESHGILSFLFEARKVVGCYQFYSIVFGENVTLKNSFWNILISAQLGFDYCQRITIQEPPDTSSFKPVILAIVVALTFSLLFLGQNEDYAVQMVTWAQFNRVRSWCDVIETFAEKCEDVSFVNWLLWNVLLRK